MVFFIKEVALILGAGYHGGFGATKGSRSVIAADSTLVGNGKGFRLKEAARKVKKIEGYTDVAVHGSPDSISFNFIKDGIEREIILDHRRLAKFLKSDKGYRKGNIRLLSCRTGSETGTFAQNLANKMGVTVRAPSDTLFILPNGEMVIGPNWRTNSGRWIDYYPQKGAKK